MEYDKEFEEYVSGIPMSDAMRRNMQRAWQAARKDHYRIGEEVEARAHSFEGFGRGVVTAHISGGFAVVQPFNVRRITAWTPKEGEAVFFRCSDKACPGILLGDSLLQYGDKQIRCFDLKPFSAEKIGKKWEEI